MYTRILVPVDGSPAADAGLAEAVRIARFGGAQIRLIHVVDEMPVVLSADGHAVLSADLLSALKRIGEGVLQRCRTMVVEGGVAVDTALFERLSGRLCDLVADEARTWNADLVVIGTHGRPGIGRLLLGSDAEQIVRSSPVPVLLVRAQEPKA